MLRRLVDMQYRRNDLNLVRGTFRVRGDTLEFVGVEEELVHRIEFFGDDIEAINVVNLLTGEYVESKDAITIFPAKHFITPDEKLQARGRSAIEIELEERLKYLQGQRQAARSATARDAHALRPRHAARGRLLQRRRELQRATSRGASRARRRRACSTSFRRTGYSSSTSRTCRCRRSTACTRGDRVAQGLILVEHGFRLPSAMDNRPLMFDEFTEHVNQVVYVSGDARRRTSSSKSTQVVGDDHPADGSRRSRSRGAPDEASGRRL